MKLLVAAVAALLSGSAFADTCSEAAKVAERDGAYIIPRATGSVVGTGRVKFYWGPVAGCASRAFLVPGDSFIAYQQYRGWTFVMYTHPVTGADTSGWLPSTRLILTGSIGAGP